MDVATAPDDRNTRHLSDVVRLALALLCLATAVVVVRGAQPGVVEINVSRPVNELPAASRRR
jgi:hypothetical protein